MLEMWKNLFIYLSLVRSTKPGLKLCNYSIENCTGNQHHRYDLLLFTFHSGEHKADLAGGKCIWQHRSVETWTDACASSRVPFTHNFTTPT